MWYNINNNMSKELFKKIFKRHAKTSHKEKKEDDVFVRDMKISKKEREVSKIISARFGRALERLGDR